MQGGPSYTYVPRVIEALDALSERAENQTVGARN
jgi:hypothetical protein